MYFPGAAQAAAVEEVDAQSVTGAGDAPTADVTYSLTGTRVLSVTAGADATDDDGTPSKKESQFQHTSDDDGSPASASPCA